MANHRSETNTARVKTKYGSHYVHVSHVMGDVVDVRISSPGKFIDTAVGKMLEDMSDAIGQEIRIVRARWARE